MDGNNGLLGHFVDMLDRGGFLFPHHTSNTYTKSKGLFQHVHISELYFVGKVTPGAGGAGFPNPFSRHFDRRIFALVFRLGDVVCLWQPLISGRSQARLIMNGYIKECQSRPKGIPFGCIGSFSQCLLQMYPQKCWKRGPERVPSTPAETSQEVLDRHAQAVSWRMCQFKSICTQVLAPG